MGITDFLKQKTTAAKDKIQAYQRGQEEKERQRKIAEQEARIRYDQERLGGAHQVARMEEAREKEFAKLAAKEGRMRAKAEFNARLNQQPPAARESNPLKRTLNIVKGFGIGDKMRNSPAFNPGSQGTGIQIGIRRDNPSQPAQGQPMQRQNTGLQIGIRNDNGLNVNPGSGMKIGTGSTLRIGLKK